MLGLPKTPTRQRLKSAGDTPIDISPIQSQPTPSSNKPLPPRLATHPIHSLRSESADPFETPEPPPTPVQFLTQKHPTIRNRSLSTQTVQTKHPLSVQQLLHKKARQMGRVKFASTTPSSPGIGSGILVGRNYFLASAHCLNPNGKTVIELGPNQKDRYSATLVPTDSEEAKAMGLRSDISGDMILLKLPNKNEKAPGDKYGFTTIQPPTDKHPKILYHLGFSSGRDLSHSVTPFNPKLLTESLAKTPGTLSGKLVTWGEGKDTRKGIITTINPNKDGSTTITMTGQTKKGKKTYYSYTIKEDKVYKTKDYKAGKEKPLKTPFFLQTTYQFGPDHVIISHKTTEGSSGGIYFDEEGNIFAVHHGSPTEERFEAAPTHHYQNHQADFPWIKNRTPLHTINNEGKPYSCKEKKAPLPPVKEGSKFKHQVLKIRCFEVQDKKNAASGLPYRSITRIASLQTFYTNSNQPTTTPPKKCPPTSTNFGKETYSLDPNPHDTPNYQGKVSQIYEDIQNDLIHFFSTHHRLPIAANNETTKKYTYSPPL